MVKITRHIGFVEIDQEDGGYIIPEHLLPDMQHIFEALAVGLVLTKDGLKYWDAMCNEWKKPES